jgi:hypothetical protein
LSNFCKFSIGRAKIPAVSLAFQVVGAPFRDAKICQKYFWCLKRQDEISSQPAYSEQSRSNCGNSIHESSFLCGLGEVVVLCLHILEHSAERKFELGAKTMFKSSVLQIQDRGTAEERLWRAVITKTLEEWMCGPLSFSRKAEQFLFDDNKDFKAVCSSAGMDPDRLRKRLKTIRARGIQKENIPFRVRTHKRLSLPQPAGWGQRAFGI